MAIVASYAYDTWGNLTSVSESIPNANGWSNPYRYDGRDGVRYDASDGLYWMSVRAYDPTIGRFLARDPLGRAPLFFADQPYAYAGNNPVSNVDPSGQRYAGASASQTKQAAARQAQTRVKTTKGSTPKNHMTWDSTSLRLLGEFGKDEGLALGALAVGFGVCVVSDGAACAWVGLPALSFALQYAHDALVVLDKLVRHTWGFLSLGNPTILGIRLNRVLIDVAQVVIALSGFGGLLRSIVKDGATLWSAPLSPDQGQRQLKHWLSVGSFELRWRQIA